MSSRFRSFQLRNPARKLLQRKVRFPRSAHTLGSNQKIDFRSSATLGSWLPNAAGNKPPLFAPRKSGVYAGPRNFAACSLPNLASDAHTIRILADTDQREHQEQLELVGEIAPHILHIIA